MGMMDEEFYLRESALWNIFADTPSEPTEADTAKAQLLEKNGDLEKQEVSELQPIDMEETAFRGYMLTTHRSIVNE